MKKIVCTAVSAVILFFPGAAPARAFGVSTSDMYKGKEVRFIDSQDRLRQWDFDAVLGAEDMAKFDEDIRRIKVTAERIAVGIHPKEAEATLKRNRAGIVWLIEGIRKRIKPLMRSDELLSSSFEAAVGKSVDQAFANSPHFQKLRKLYLLDAELAKQEAKYEEAKP